MRLKEEDRSKARTLATEEREGRITVSVFGVEESRQVEAEVLVKRKESPCMVTGKRAEQRPRPRGSYGGGLYRTLLRTDSINSVEQESAALVER